ncbi:capsular polysaccharide synthesis protein [Clostridium sp. PL3]|uniref:Capsular polysaccharide synthesis protein n=1 Tax=Clostridium thailandense TaxID=2794346 RepID=A0A949TLK2_9CLOT|nr:capsular polysaccharide synthesis protein [Clostridium thailandense]MBV7271527.1 capsular polysaccharide synthesis protein [Clostridium thailandense]
MIYKIKQRLNQIYNLNKNFGFRIAFFALLEALFNYDKRPLRIFLKISKVKQKYIMQYLYNNYRHIIAEYKNAFLLEKHFEASTKKIWVFWWQGYDEAPELIRICINSIQKNCGEHEVILISEKNLKKYIDFPQYIYKKLNSEIISFTEFSNIVRIGLLNKYGGLWIDATFYLTESISNNIFKPEFFTGKLEFDENITSLSAYRWNTALLSGNTSDIIFSFINSFNIHYWEREDYLIDYFLFDYIILLGYNYIPEIKREIDSVPINNLKLFKLNLVLNDKFDNEVYKDIIKDTVFHKLQRRQKLNLKTKKNRETFYGYIAKEIYNSTD